MNMTKAEVAKTGLSEGAYVQDVPYTWSFFEFQNPLLLSYVARLNGYEMPPIDKPFTYCDLGCGNGVSVNLLASAYPQGQFYGVDFNSEHIANAQACADKGGVSNATFLDASFGDFAENNPPKFDYIALHGIYSWVGPEVRAQVRTLIDKTLKPGGLVYVCYNTLPGWSELIPLWKMMQTYTAHLDVDSLSKARIGLQQMAGLRDAGARYFRANPSAGKFLDRLLKRDPSYVAHEFCNGSFAPMYFSDVARKLQEIGLSYAGTAKIHRNNSANIVGKAHTPHLDEAHDDIDRESRISFIRNEFFRRDVYIRESSPKPPQQRQGLFDDMIIGAVVADHQLEEKLDLGYRKVDLTKPMPSRLKKLASIGNYSFAQLRDHPDLASFDKAEIEKTIHDLIAGYQFQPIAAHSKNPTYSAQTRFHLTSGINRYFLENRLLLDKKVYLESPALGSAIRLNLIYGLIARALDGQTIAGARGFLQNQLAPLGPDRLAKIGKPLVANTDAWLEGRLERFETRYLPVLLKYGILKT